MRDRLALKLSEVAMGNVYTLTNDIHRVLLAEGQITLLKHIVGDAAFCRHLMM